MVIVARRSAITKATTRQFSSIISKGCETEPGAGLPSRKRYNFYGMNLE
jgi:hypothetical protein